jgi:hypothetical protein
MVSRTTATRVYDFLIRTHKDKNREVVVKYLEKIITYLAEKDLIATSLAVLFNLFNDFGMSHMYRCRVVADR